MEKVRVGFIGAGGLANHYHYPSLAEDSRVELAAICDLDEAKLNRTADKYGVAARYANHKEMLERASLDAVYVIMPPMPLHPLVMDCLTAGKHVVTEKPPGVRTEDARAWAAEAERRGLKTMVLFNRRYASVFEAAKRAVNETGPPSMAMSEFHKDMAGEGPYYGISIIRTDIIHVVDALRDMLGDVADVVAHVDHHYEKWEGSYNLFNALIRFQNGASGILSANRTSGNRYERFEYHGRSVSTYIRSPEQAEIFRKGQPVEIVTGEGLTGSTDPRITYGYKAENVHFIDCLIEDRLPRTHFGDAVKTMELVDKIEAFGR
jgi:predicted dehydrogenase